MAYSEFMDKVPKERYLGLDLVRLLILVPIVHFHTTELIFGVNTFPLYHNTFFYGFFDPYARFMSFNGFSIVLFVFFLFGFRNKKARSLLRYIPIVLLGQLVLNYVLTENKDQSFIHFEWDIYSYLASSLIFLACFKNIENALQRMIGSLILLLLPYDYFLGSSSLLNNNILFSYCKENDAMTWPLMPWILLPFFSFSLGELIVSSKFSAITKKEMALWLVSLGSAAFFWGAFYEVPVGESFYCFVFNRTLIEIWAHLLIVIFMIRISLLDSVNNTLKRRSLFKWISKLKWNQNLWVCYLLHILILGSFSSSNLFFAKNPIWFDVLYLSIFAVVEVIARSLIALKSRIIQTKKRG